MSLTTSPLRLLLALTMFAGALVGFDRLFFAVATHTSVSADRRSELLRKLENLNDKSRYQILVLGTSRTFEAVHPATLLHVLGVHAYKEAFQGKGPRYNYEFYQLYKKVVGTPRLVIYGVDYFIFGIQSEAWAMARFAEKPGEAPRDAVRPGPLLMLANKKTRDRALVTFLERVQERLVPLPPTAEFNPERNVRDMERYTGNLQSRVVEQPAPATFEPIPFPRFPGFEGAYLVKLLQQLRADGVEAMFIYTPDYVATYRTDFEHDEFAGSIRKMLSPYPNCAFFNYSDPERFPLSRAVYFVDGAYGNPNSHLSKAGVAEFERLFLPDLKAMWARSSARGRGPASQ